MLSVLFIYAVFRPYSIHYIAGWQRAEKRAPKHNGFSSIFLLSALYYFYRHQGIRESSSIDTKHPKILNGLFCDENNTRYRKGIAQIPHAILNSRRQQAYRGGGWNADLRECSTTEIGNQPCNHTYRVQDENTMHMFHTTSHASLFYY